MYRYVENNRGAEISGSTTGVVVEWIVHNAAYETGKVADSVGLNGVGNYLIEK